MSRPILRYVFVSLEQPAAADLVVPVLRVFSGGFQIPAPHYGPNTTWNPPPSPRWGGRRQPQLAPEVTSSPRASFTARWCRLTSVYTVGTTKSVNSVPTVMPPTIVQPIC